MAKQTIASLEADKAAYIEKMQNLEERRADENSRRVSAERKLEKANADIENLRLNIWGRDKEIARLGGMIEMLERLGTIPKQELTETYGNSYDPHFILRQGQ